MTNDCVINFTNNQDGSISFNCQNGFINMYYKKTQIISNTINKNNYYKQQDFIERISNMSYLNDLSNNHIIKTHEDIKYFIKEKLNNILYDNIHIKLGIETPKKLILFSNDNYSNNISKQVCDKANNIKEYIKKQEILRFYNMSKINLIKGIMSKKENIILMYWY